MPAAARKPTPKLSPAEIRADAMLAQINEAEMAALASALARLLISAAKNGGKPQPAGPPYRGRSTAEISTPSTSPAGAPRRVVPKPITRAI